GEIENVACVNDGFSMKWQPKVRQILRNQNTQTRIVNGDAIMKRVNSENGRIWRKPENCFDVCAGPEICIYLSDK
ncbi:hypothetical protein OFB51_26920, partial [Escherichia coli]|nr:hypothetical protein [Escherichia coli]